MFTKPFFVLKFISFLHFYIFPNVFNNVTMQKRLLQSHFQFSLKTIKVINLR